MYYYSHELNYTKRYYHIDTIAGERPHLFREVRDHDKIGKRQAQDDFMLAGYNHRSYNKWHEMADRELSRLFFLKPMPTPIRAVKNRVMLFNHVESVLEAYSADAQLLEKVPIRYHERKRWGEEVLIDEVAGKAYTWFLEKGHPELHEIDLATGELGPAMRIYHPYVEKIRVRDGYVYFLYREFGSLQRKTLYRSLFVPGAG